MTCVPTIYAVARYAGKMLLGQGNHPFFQATFMHLLSRNSMSWHNWKVADEKSKVFQHGTISDHIPSLARSSPDSFITTGEIVGISRSSMSKVLVQLTTQGELIRVGRGLYYSPKDTLLGPSRPSQLAMFERMYAGKYRPTLTFAAHILGLTTQMPARPQFVLFASKQPQNLNNIQIILRRGKRPPSLGKLEGALLEFIRDGGKCAETNGAETCIRLQAVIKHHIPLTNLALLCQASLLEPPRVRAILGALLECSGIEKHIWEPLRKSLNPELIFDFGLFFQLDNCKEWQAK